jgi:lipoprotein Spr
MNMVVERARGLIGTRFRPQGRAAEMGIDCLGLVLAAFGLPVNTARRNYPMRGVPRAEIEAGLAPWFRRVSRVGTRAGDVLLLQPGPGVFHLGIASGEGLIHADVRLGVVERPGVAPWPVVAAFRRRARGA